MLGNYWTSVVIAVLYLFLCEIRADQNPNNLNKLEFWTRESPSNGRRQQKKQSKLTYPRQFQPVEDGNDLIESVSYDEAYANDISKTNLPEKRSDRSDKHNPSSLIVWQTYVKENSKKETAITFAKKSQAATETTKIKNNFVINHIHFEKHSDNDRKHIGNTAKVGKENENIGVINTFQPVLRKKTASKFGTRNTVKKSGHELPQGYGDSTIMSNDPFAPYMRQSPNSRELVDEFLSPYAIVPQMTRILSEFTNTNVSTEVLGRTAEFNDIVLFKISANKNETAAKFRSTDLHKYDDENLEKKIIFLVHGLSVMGLHSLSCLTQENKLKILLGYYLDHLDNFDIFFIPLANPDGYVASRSENRGFWNKNMSPQTDCRGVTLDRNFDVGWNDSYELSSCSQAYPGPHPFSEIETKAISNVLHYNGHRIVAYIHVHAGTYDSHTFKGDAVLYPRGYTDLPGDDDKYLDIKGEIEEAMRNASFRVMSVTVDNLFHWYGKVTGTSVDYAAQVFGIPFAMEFVMQLYESDFFASQEAELVDYSALTQIWRRIIFVVFKHFAKSVGIKNGSEEK